MVLSDENNPTYTKPFTSQGEAAIGNRKFGVTISHNRRALGTINRKLVGNQPYPRVVNKRGLSESREAQDENLPHPAHRPVTRNFAAQIASTRQQCHEKTKKPDSSSAQIFTIFEDCSIIDVEQQETALLDHPMPMPMEQIEHVENEKDHMEVEMEDIFEETVMDIDSCDKKNPLALIEYVNDLFSYYKKMEECTGVSPSYMSQQIDINEKMRSILIDWLIEVHHKFELREETLFLTVNLIDRFLAQHSVVRKKLQLVGLVAMLLACKYEEVSVPVVDDLIFISDKAYTKKELLDMERVILNVLQFNMSVPTPYMFLRRYLKAAESDKKLELLAFFLIELCLVEYEMIKYPPSFLAAAAIYTAQCSLYGFKQWTKTCEWYTGFAENQLLECSKLIVSFHKNASTGRLTGVHRKYCTSKFGYAAKSGPALFLIEEELNNIQQ